MGLLLALTLLNLVNLTLDLLRNDRVVSLSSTSELTDVVIGVLNDAKDDVLGNYDWDFLERHNGQAFFPAPVEYTTDGASGISLAERAVAATISGSQFTASNEADFSSNSLAVRVLIPGDTSFPDTSHRLVYLDTIGTNTLLGFENTYRGAAVSLGSFTIWSNEHILPATVREVLSVRDEEGEFRLDFADRTLDLEARIPRGTERFEEDPPLCNVGGIGFETHNDSVTGFDATRTTGTVLSIWDPPNEAKSLKYSYVYKHPDLAAETDTLQGVPDSIARIIVRFAYQKLLSSNVEAADPGFTRQVFAENTIMLTNARRRHRPMPARRAVPTPFGSSRGIRVNPRWDSQTVDAPT